MSRRLCNHCLCKQLTQLAEADGARIEQIQKTLGAKPTQMDGTALIRVKDGVRTQIAWMWTIGERCEC